MVNNDLSFIWSIISFIKNTFVCVISCLCKIIDKLTMDIRYEIYYIINSYTDKYDNKKIEIT